MTAAESDLPTGAARRILVVAHTGREEARAVTRAIVGALLGHGLVVRMLEDEAKEAELPAGVEVESVPCEDAVSTATLARPASFAARITRTAISPRLATRTLVM